MTKLSTDDRLDLDSVKWVLVEGVRRAFARVSEDLPTQLQKAFSDPSCSTWVSVNDAYGRVTTAAFDQVCSEFAALLAAVVSSDHHRPRH